MTYDTLSDRLGLALRRGRHRIRNKKRHGFERDDLSRLSDHILKDIGYRRDGDWFGPNTDY